MTLKNYEKKMQKLIGPNYIRMQRMGFRDDETGIWWPKFKCPICKNWFFAYLEDIVLGNVKACPSCGHWKPIFLEELEQDQRKKISIQKQINNALLEEKEKDKQEYIAITKTHTKKKYDNGCMSLGEKYIYGILSKHNILFFTQYSFENCINPKTNCNLYFDFYIPKYNCCIEYDGKQHFEPVKFFGGEDFFKETQYRDEIKNQYCLKNNINLIRIKYDCKDIEKTIFSQLKN